MYRPVLFAALLAALTGWAVAAAAEPGHHRLGRQVRPQLQVYPAGAVAVVEPGLQPNSPPVGFLPSHDHPGPAWWRTTPWYYDPQGPCEPPWCLPSYHRHRAGFRFADPAALPLEAVLERLELQDYHSFGNVLLTGANYNIEARNRYGQVVRLIVNAGNGQIRRTLQ